MAPPCSRLTAEWTHNRSPDLETIRYRFGGWSLPFAAISVSSMLTTSRLRPQRVALAASWPKIISTEWATG